jgi:hypothetical protein
MSHVMHIGLTRKCQLKEVPLLSPCPPTPTPTPTTITSQFFAEMPIELTHENKSCSVCPKDQHKHLTYDM